MKANVRAQYSSDQSPSIALDGHVNYETGAYGAAYSAYNTMNVSAAGTLVIPIEYDKELRLVENTDTGDARLYVVNNQVPFYVGLTKVT